MNGGLFMSKFDAVLFDFDGTVADTGENRFTVNRDATSRVSAPGAAGSSMPTVLNSQAMKIYASLSARQ